MSGCTTSSWKGCTKMGTKSTCNKSARGGGARMRATARRELYIRNVTGASPPLSAHIFRFRSQSGIARREGLRMSSASRRRDGVEGRLRGRADGKGWWQREATMGATTQLEWNGHGGEGKGEEPWVDARLDDGRMVGQGTGMLGTEPH